MPKPTLPDLGAYLREQREHAELSLRQVADAAGISNPYLSQIERGLKHPSAEILQAIAKGLRISAESLYVKAGLLDEGAETTERTVDVRGAVQADPLLSDRQRAVLLDVYDSFVAATQASTGRPNEASVDAQLSTLSADEQARVTNLPARRRRGRRSTPLPARSGAVRTGTTTGTTAAPAPDAQDGTQTDQTHKTSRANEPATMEGNAS